MTINQAQASLRDVVGQLLKITDEPLVKSAITKLELAFNDLEKISDAEYQRLDERR